MGGCFSSCPDDESRSLHSSNHPRSMMSRLHHDKEAVRYIDGRQYHDEPASRYPLPRDEQEADRLHEQHFVTKELLGCNILAEAYEHLNFHRGGLRILDVCCGPATWLCETSLEYNNSQFTGVDMSDAWPKDIRPVNLQFRRTNILAGIPYPDHSFDFVQLRFVVLAFSTDEWRKVLAEIRRVLRPGGLVQCVDLDMRASLQSSLPASTLQKFDTFYAVQGLDASAGAKLDMRLTDLDFRIVQSEYREVPLGWGGPVGTASLNLFMGKIHGLAPWFKRAIDMPDEAFRAFADEVELAMVQSKAYMGLHALLAVKPE